jgi:hypothetical protein
MYWIKSVRIDLFLQIKISHGLADFDVIDRS